MITGADICGHWQREYIVAPGLEDRTTEVHWLQGDAIFADLRIPADLPDMSDADCLADLPVANLLELCRCEGFAGYASVSQNVCEWTRIINWRGPQAQVDRGRLAWGDLGGLVETGFDIDYRELWYRIEKGPFWARIYSSGTWRLFLVSSNTSFLLAIDDTAAKEAEPRNIRIERGAKDVRKLADLFRSEYTLGFWDKQFAVAEFSTNPMRSGLSVVDRQVLDSPHLVLERKSFTGETELEHWTMLENVAAIACN